MIDMWTHTLLAVGCTALAYYAGYYIQIKKLVADVCDTVLYDFIETLEKGGFIQTDIDDEGDLELIPIKEIVAQHSDVKEK